MNLAFTPDFKYVYRIVALSFLLMASVLPAQENADSDVHITPRRETSDLAAPHLSAATKDSHSGRAHSKPLLTNVDLVLVPVTITDSRAQAVIGLDRANFVVSEDNRPQAIRSFSVEDAPLSLGVVFDTSKSMANKMEQAREAVLEFFKTSNPQDDFFMVTFSDRPELLVDFTTSVESIENRLMYARPQGHTSLLDAVYMALEKIRPSRYERRALLIISDGGDNHSRYTGAEIKRMVEEADVELYGIGIFDTLFKTPEERSGQQLLNAITEATGGRTFAIKDVQDLPQAAATIARELRNQYLIGYRSDNPARDGKWRKIKVQVVPPPGMSPLHVYAKSGYYSPAR